MNTANRPGASTVEPRATLSLLDYRRRVAELYARVRAMPPDQGHEVWRAGRDELFRHHDQSPIPPERRPSFGGLPVWDYDPTLRFTAALDPVDAAPIGLPHSGAGVTSARAWASTSLEVDGRPITLTLYRLAAYGDGVFLPFRDATSGSETYGGGRYLLDTVKGADLGSSESTITIDFNFAYHPSCVHDSRWSCPLSPADNTLPVAIRGGEHL